VKMQVFQWNSKQERKLGIFSGITGVLFQSDQLLYTQTVIVRKCQELTWKGISMNKRVFEGNCWRCDARVTFSVDKQELFDFAIKGQLIQIAMSSLTAAQREFMISGTCTKCFDEITAEPEEDEGQK